MTYRLRMRRVVLPQALRVIIPPTGNEFIAMMKDTALIAVLGTQILWADPFRRAQLLGNADFKFLEALLVAAGCYWLLTAIFTFFQKRLETRMSKGYTRGGTGPDKAVSGALAPSTHGGVALEGGDSTFMSGSAGGGSGGGGMMMRMPPAAEESDPHDEPGSEQIDLNQPGMPAEDQEQEP
jgi:uncharacterized membrane protein YgcG